MTGNLKGYFGHVVVISTNVWEHKTATSQPNHPGSLKNGCLQMKFS